MLANVPVRNVLNAWLLNIEFVFLDDFPDLLLHLLWVDILEVCYQIISSLLEHRHQSLVNATLHIFGGSVARSFLFRTHLREEQHFLNLGLSRHEHHEAVDADADARGGRHAILQRA